MWVGSMNFYIEFYAVANSDRIWCAFKAVDWISSLTHTYTDLVPAVFMQLSWPAVSTECNTVGGTGCWCLFEYCMCFIRECFINWLWYIAGKQEFLCI